MRFAGDSAYVAFFLELTRSDLAVWMQLTPYVYATLEGLHLIGVAFFFGPIVLLDLKLLGLAGALPSAALERFLLRIAVPAFALIALSGALMFVPSADRYATSPVFAAKLVALAVGGLNALAFHRAARRGGDRMAAPRATLAANAAGSSTRTRRMWHAHTAAVASLLVWIAVIALGRAMGYERRAPPAADLDELPYFERAAPAGANPIGDR